MVAETRVRQGERVVVGVLSDLPRVPVVDGDHVLKVSGSGHEIGVAVAVKVHRKHASAKVAEPVGPLCLFDESAVPLQFPPLVGAPPIRTAMHDNGGHVGVLIAHGPNIDVLQIGSVEGPVPVDGLGGFGQELVADGRKRVEHKDALCAALTVNRNDVGVSVVGEVPHSGFLQPIVHGDVERRVPVNVRQRTAGIDRRGVGKVQARVHLELTPCEHVLPAVVVEIAKFEITGIVTRAGPVRHHQLPRGQVVIEHSKGRTVPGGRVAGGEDHDFVAAVTVHVSGLHVHEIADGLEGGGHVWNEIEADGRGAHGRVFRQEKVAGHEGGACVRGGGDMVRRTAMGEHRLVAERAVALPFKGPLFDPVLVDVQPDLPGRVEGVVNIHNKAQTVHGHVTRDGKAKRCVAGAAGKVDVFVHQASFE